MDRDPYSKKQKEIKKKEKVMKETTTKRKYFLSPMI